MKLWGFARTALTRNIIVGIMLLLVAGMLLFLGLYMAEVRRNQACSEEKVQMEREHSRERATMQDRMSIQNYTVGELKAKLDYLEKLLPTTRKQQLRQQR